MEIPIELFFVGAILATLVMGALAITFVLRRAAPLLTTVRIDNAASVQKEAIDVSREAVAVTREAMALQRETNRLLSEILARLATPTTPTTE